MRTKSLVLPTLAAVVVASVALALSHSRQPAGRAAGGASTSVVTAGRPAHVTISNYAFTPASLTVKAGTTITVTNVDATAHTATARSGAFDTGTLPPGHSARFVLNKPGVYPYYCQFHAFMTGTITVVK